MFRTLIICLAARSVRIHIADGARFQSGLPRKRAQIVEKEGRLPDCLIACVGGGSNSIGMFHSFLADEQVRMIGVEAVVPQRVRPARGAIQHRGRWSSLEFCRAR